MKGRALVVFCSLLLGGNVYAASYQNYTNVYNDIFKDYNIHIRPVLDDAKPVDVSVDFVLLSVDGISERDQSIRSNGWLVLGWQDEILTWDPSLYNNVVDIQVRQKNIWKPDITIKNTVKAISKIGFDEQLVSINASGNIMWSPGEIFVTSCDLEVTYYPFDVQFCGIIIYLWLSTNSEINLYTGLDKIDLSMFSKNGQWDLIETTSEVSSEGQYSEVMFEMKLKRRRQFYVVNVIIPILFLSCVGPLVFALPAESGEKMGYSVTVLLAYTVFITIISDKMPQTSIQTAILSVYLTSMVSISAFSVILSALILKIHHKPETTKPLSKLQSFTRVLRRILCYRDAKQYALVTPVTSERFEKTDTGPGSKEKLQTGSTTENEVTWKMFAETLDFTFLSVFASVTVLITVPALVMMGVMSEM